MSFICHIDIPTWIQTIVEVGKHVDLIKDQLPDYYSELVCHLSKMADILMSMDSFFHLMKRSATSMSSLDERSIANRERYTFAMKAIEARRIKLQGYVDQLFVFFDNITTLGFQRNLLISLLSVSLAKSTIKNMLGYNVPEKPSHGLDIISILTMPLSVQ